MARYSTYPTKDNIESTDLLSGINEQGSLRHFTHDALVDAITAIVLQYASDTNLSQDEADAIKNALAPSIDNVFATMNDLDDIEILWEAESDGFIKPLINPDTSDPRYVGTEHLKPKNRTETAAFSLQSGDEGARIRYTEATDINVTCFNSLEMFQPITIEQAGAGIMTVVGDTGVTVQGFNSGVKSPGQYGYIQIEKVADNVINVIGGVA